MSGKKAPVKKKDAAHSGGRGGISEQEARNLQQIFAEYDQDNSGEISLTELHHFFARTGSEM